jgi:glycosyltransferase involved in cell wall biosynthesis
MCGYVSDKELPALYTGAAVIAFPSLQEGFGLPIIEGFASNTPVLTSNVCSMPEVAGDAAILVNPYDINDMSEKLELLLTDKDLSDKMIAAGKNRLKYFTWESSANQIIDKILNYKEKGNADC